MEKEETRRTGEASSALSEDRSDVRQDPSRTDGRTDRPASLSFLLPCCVGDKQRRKRRRGERDRSHSVPEVIRGAACPPRHRLRVRYVSRECAFALRPVSAEVETVVARIALRYSPIDRSGRRVGEGWTVNRSTG